MTVTFPIPAWDRNQGNIRTARAQIRDAVQSLRQTQNDQLNAVADAIGRYQMGRQTVLQYETKTLPVLKRALDLATEGRAKGVYDFTRFLTVQRTAVEARRDYIDALDQVWGAACDVVALLQLERFPYGELGPPKPEAPK
jgi:cobalt-zinc-cadmium efflux system outer membrane protein